MAKTTLHYASRADPPPQGRCLRVEEVFVLFCAGVCVVFVILLFAAAALG